MSDEYDEGSDRGFVTEALGALTGNRPSNTDYYAPGFPGPLPGPRPGPYPPLPGYLSGYGPAFAKVLNDADASEQGLRAVMFTQAEFKGESQSLTPGKYDIGGLTLPNDSISSVVVSKGLKVTLFEHAGFTGRSAVITSDTGAVGADLRSKVSCVIVEKVSADLLPLGLPSS